VVERKRWVKRGEMLTILFRRSEKTTQLDCPPSEKKRKHSFSEGSLQTTLMRVKSSWMVLQKMVVRER